MLPIEAKQAAKITELIEKTIVHTRSLIKILNPIRLEEDGLISALEELAYNVEKLSGISCIFKHNDFVFTDDNTISIQLYRIVQEAVNNAIKHAKPNNILISLISLNDRIIEIIKDDGYGISEISKKNGNMGLNIMRYRSNMIGASLNIRRNIDGGTTVICSLKHTQ